MTMTKKRLVILPKSQQVKSELMEKHIAARSAYSESAMRDALQAEVDRLRAKS